MGVKIKRVRVTVSGIEWDTDGEDVSLPESMTVTVNVAEGFEEVTETKVVDACSDETGWLISKVSGFTVEPSGAE